MCVLECQRASTCLLMSKCLQIQCKEQSTYTNCVWRKSGSPLTPSVSSSIGNVCKLTLQQPFCWHVNGFPLAVSRRTASVASAIILAERSSEGLCTHIHIAKVQCPLCPPTPHNQHTHTKTEQKLYLWMGSCHWGAEIFALRLPRSAPACLEWKTWSRKSRHS